MSRIRVLAALAVVAAIAACSDQTPTPAPAPAQTLTFELSAIPYSFPVPAGFCAPTGPYIARAQQVAAGDAVNITLLTFNDCASMAQGGNLARWGMVKAPRSMAMLDAGSRDELIAEMKRQFDSGGFQRSLDQATQTGNVTASVKPLGTDAYGAYVGGTLVIEGRTFVGVWSMTVIKRRVMGVYIYGPYTSERDIMTVLDQVKEATRSFILANIG